MKIGILTYHASHNYGAFLQAYALCNAIDENTGNNVEIINFNMIKAQEFYKAQLRSKNPIKRLYAKRRYGSFEKAVARYLPLSEKRLVSDDCAVFADWVNGRYDFIVAGSDEIWKLDGFRGFPNPYWLPGVEGCRKLSYAASSRTEPSAISDEMRRSVREYLCSFDYIGVRDHATKELIEPLAPEGKTIHLNCDPTFAYDFHTSKEHGRRLIRDKFRVNGKKKCIALMLGNAKLSKSIIRMYGRDFDFIPLYYYQYHVKKNAVLDPFEWMEAIAGADGLITDFFHGMVFALKNNTPFISFESRKISDKEYSKAYDLLKRNSLEKHFFMAKDPEEQSLREVGSFLADVLAGKAENDFRVVCEKEKELFIPFLREFPDQRLKHIATEHQEDYSDCRACEAACSTKSIMAETKAASRLPSRDCRVVGGRSDERV